MLGHWILIDLIQLKQLTFPEIVYFDPTGRGFDHNKKIEKVLIVTQMKYDGKIFVNKRNYQLPGSVICGAIVAYISLLRARGFSYAVIEKMKLSNDLKLIVKVIPEIIKYFLSSKKPNIERFSLDFL